MGIDWFTLAAQVVNFLVLVWLLKRFLYGRIVRAMDDREAEIAGRLSDAAQARAAAEKEAEQYRAKNRELEEQRDRLLTEMKGEVEARRREMTEAARAEVEEAQTRWLDALAREREALVRDLRERVGQQVLAGVRHALKELAGVELEREAVNVFLARLRALPVDERDAIAAAIRDSDPAVEIRTAFPLPPEQREEVSQAIRGHLGERADVRFVTAPDLIFGVEMSAHSHRLVWNLDEYLERLEDQFFEELESRAGQYAKSR